MTKTYIPILCLLFTGLLSKAQEKVVTADSKIQRVIVFLQGAQIERSAQAQIPAGTSLLTFRGLSAEIDEQSIQVKGAGNFTILAVNKQTDFLQEQELRGSLTRLQDQIAELRDQKEIQDNIIAILKKEEDMLASNQSVGNGGAGLDLNKLKQALDFQKARLSENKVKQLSTRKEIQRLNTGIKKLENQLNEEAGKPGNKTSNIVVKLSSGTSTSGSFVLTYLVKNASWYPTYDLRATDVNKPINLIYRANISQQSGEEWKDVKLTLSSGDPSIGGRKPSLRPYQVGYNISRHTPAADLTSVRGKVTDSKDGAPLIGVSVRIKGTSIGSNTDVNGNYTLSVPAPGSTLQFSYIGYVSHEQVAYSSEMNVRLNQDSKSLNEVAVVGYGAERKMELTGSVAGVQIRGTSSLIKQSVPLEVQVQQSQTNVQFEVAQPYSIYSDGKQLTVEIAEHELPADYRYHAVPKIKQEAYLTASVTGINDLNLLSGEANVFFDGAFLGKTLINIENTNDTLVISLGADKNVLVKRVAQKGQNEKSFMGSNQKAVRAFSLDVLSRKAYPIKLTVEDQVPVSNTSEVTVESEELSGGKLDPATGLVKWDLQLLPQGKKSLQLKYEVKYPKNRPVSLE